MYIFFDGDNVGNTIARLLISGDIDTASKLSLKIQGAILEINKYLNDIDVIDIIICGGDDILIKAYSIDIDEIISNIKHIFNTETGLSISYGIGNTISECMWNLQVAKIFNER